MEFLGRFLEVDLTENQFAISDLSEELVRKFLVGRGLNAWLLYQNIREDVHPLEPGNVLLLSCGLLTGTAAPASSRLHVNAKSPLTGIIGSSNVGGEFGAELRSSGFQCILIRGRAQRPVCLWIHDEKAEILDAGRLWGLDTWETQKRLRRDLRDERLKVIAIGPAGEKMVSFACVMANHDHAAGRTGMGAVMGSKNLKAIVVLGHKKPPFIDTSGAAAIKSYIQKIKSSPRFREIATYGSVGDVGWTNDMGILATRNYRETQFEHFDQIDGRRFHEYVTRRKSCYRCPVHCKADITVKHGRFAGMEGTRPEFEPVVALGSKCGLGDTDALLYLCDLCSRLGIDSISTGSVIAFAMDLYDRGILTLEDTNGIDLTWGNPEAMERLIYQIVRREGLGGILSCGVREGARIIGRGSEKFAYHAKGLELTGYDPRGLMGTALGYAVSPRGGDFTSIYATAEYRWSPERAEKELGNRQAVDRLSPEGKAALIKRSLIVSVVLDSLGLCKVPVLTLMVDFGLKNEAELMKSLTGWDTDAEDLMCIGERIVNVERLFNLRHWADAADDRLSEKFIDEPIAEGPAEGHTVQLEPMLKDFYRAMGWDEAGYPSEEKLVSLDLLESREMVRSRKLKVRKGRREISQLHLPATNRPVPGEDRRDLGRARRPR